MHVSLLYPASGTGLLLVASLTAFLGIMRFMVWLMANNVVALSSAMAVVFALIAGAYAARYLVVIAEASAEGYDLSPGPPDPREVEELFGAFLSLATALFLALLPLGAASILGLGAGVVSQVLLGLGAVYFPMALLGTAVRGDLTGSFPGRVLGAVASAPVRYLPAAAFCAGGGLLVVQSHAGELSTLPLAARIGLDAAAAWLVAAAIHRAAVLHREEAGVRDAMPFPAPPEPPSESAIPTRPMTEIEKALLDRQRR